MVLPHMLAEEAILLVWVNGRLEQKVLLGGPRVVIVLDVVGREAGIDDDDHLLAFILDLLGESLDGWERGGVDGEVSVVSHVWNVKPDTFERHVGVLVAFDVLLDVSLGLVGIGSCVPSKRPEGWKRWFANDVLVLGDDLLWATLEHEVNLKLSTGSDVAELSLALTGVSQHW